MKKVTSILLIFTFSFFNISGVALAATFTTSSEADFDEGTYNNAYYNNNRLKISAGQTSGQYTSKIFDSESTETTWDNINWTQEQCMNTCELPNNQENDTDYNQNTNMSTNVTLLHLNEAANSNNFNDDSGNSADATCSGNNCPTSGVTGKFNNAVEFHSGQTPNSIKINNLNENTFSDGIGTIEMWIAPSGSSYDYLIEHNNKEIGQNAHDRVTIIWNMGGDGSNTIGANLFQYTNAAYNPWDEFSVDTSSWTTNGNEWHHVAFVFDSTTDIGEDNMWLYIDGDLEISAEGIRSMFPDNKDANETNGVWLGNYNDSHVNYAYHGKMDEVAIYSSALSASEIQNHYLRGILNFDLEVRSCDDINCNGESFTAPSQTSPATLTLENSQYFQYRFNLSSANTESSPQIENVSISYTAPENFGIPEFNTYTYILTLILGLLLVKNSGIIPPIIKSYKNKN